MTDKITQSALILADLKRGRTITQLEALRRYRCLRLAPRIAELREAGHRIETLWDTDGKKRWGKYRMPKRRAA